LQELELSCKEEINLAGFVDFLQDFVFTVIFLQDFFKALYTCDLIIVSGKIF